MTEPQTRCAQCPLRRTAAFENATHEELAFLQSFKRAERRLDAGQTLIAEGSARGQLYTLLSGWAVRFKSLSDGRRQILNFLLPGDFVGLQERIATVSPVGVETLTDAVFCEFPLDRLWTLYEQHPSLAFDATWLVAHEERIVDDGLLSVGRRTALESVAMLLLQLHKRASTLGLAVDGAVALPVRQHHLADALGLSLVHTHRTLKRLRTLGLAALDDGVLTLPNPRALERLADYYERPAPRRPLL